MTMLYTNNRGILVVHTGSRRTFLINWFSKMIIYGSSSSSFLLEACSQEGCKWLLGSGVKNQPASMTTLLPLRRATSTRSAMMHARRFTTQQQLGGFHASMRVLLGGCDTLPNPNCMKEARSCLRFGCLYWGSSSLGPTCKGLRFGWSARWYWGSLHPQLPT